MTPARGALLSLFDAALRRVHGAAVVRDALSELDGDVALVAVGKAAAAMAEGAGRAPRLRVSRAFIALPRGYGEPAAFRGWEVHFGGHPLPDAGSLAAGHALVDWLESLPQGLRLVVLVSGGSSACVELLHDGLGLDEIVRRTADLLAAGADIRRLNAARGEWSLLKGGRALRMAGSRDVHVLVLSDVPGDDPALVGSGAFHSSALGPRLRIVATNGMALDAVVEAAASQGLAAAARGTLSGDAAKQGAAIATRLRDAPPGVYPWGGETTVALPERAGRGGRCQQLALAAAVALDGVPRITLLAAGTDGIDGDTADAGALIDGGSVSRMRAEGVDPADALARCDANRALAASGDLVNTGPTGTNVMDLVIAIVE